MADKRSSLNCVQLKCDIFSHFEHLENVSPCRKLSEAIYLKLTFVYIFIRLLQTLLMAVEGSLIIFFARI